VVEEEIGGSEADEGGDGQQRQDQEQEAVAAGLLPRGRGRHKGRLRKGFLARLGYEDGGTRQIGR